MYIPNSSPKGPRAKRGHGYKFAAQRFRQGPRVAYNLVLPMTALSQMIDVAKIGSKDNQINREIKKQHVESCDLYLDQEAEFVLGGLVLAADHSMVAFQADDQEINGKLEQIDKLFLSACDASNPTEREKLAEAIESLDDEIELASGWLWLPYGVRLEVTDGQHRIKAVLDRLERNDAVLQHPSQGIAAMIMIESRLPKRQQDFVDLGQTEPIKTTIKIDMDYRQPVTKLIKDLVEEVAIFDKQFIEFKRPSIRRASGNLYSLSNLKTAVQAMLLGSTRLGASTAQRRLTEKLDGANYDLFRDRVVDFFSRLSQDVEVFRTILDDPDSIENENLRDKFMCLNSIGLGVMGMVGHDVLLGNITMEEAVKTIAGLDWQRDNPLWEGTLRVGSGVARGGNVIELGASIVKAAGKLSLTPKDRDRLAGVDGLAAKLPPGVLDTPVESATAQAPVVQTAPVQAVGRPVLAGVGV